MRRPISIVGALVGITVIVALLVIIIIPQLADAFRVVLLGVPPGRQQLSQLAGYAGPLPAAAGRMAARPQCELPDLFKRATSYLTSGVGNVFNSAVSLLARWAVP